LILEVQFIVLANHSHMYGYAGYFGHPFHPNMYPLTRFGVTIYHIHVPLVMK